jgi:hypothetical protein
MSEQHDEDAGARVKGGFIARMRAAGPVEVAWAVVRAGVLLVSLIVALDLVGVLDVFGDEQIEPSSSSRLPEEFLYLDDERVDAYLGQLRGGLSPTEQRSLRLTKKIDARLGVEPVVQVGGTAEKTESIERTVFLRAADRFFQLESELEARYTHVDVGLEFKEIEARSNACPEIKKLLRIKEGQILRILGANLRVPAYALALAKVAHADQFHTDYQKKVSNKTFARLAQEGQRGLKRYVKSLGDDPQLPFWIKPKGRCEVFMPARYSKVNDAPSMLTGPVTIVGKVVRRLTKGEQTYFDVDTAVRWERALRESTPGVRRTLGLNRRWLRQMVNSTATVHYPGLVVLPLAIYK